MKLRIAPREGRPAAGFRRLGGYAFALLAFAVALEARFLLDGVLPAVGFPFLTFFPAVLLTAFLAGLGPALLASALSVAAAKYFFVPEIGSLAFAGLPEVIALVFFAAILLVDCVVIHAMTTSQRALRAERARAAEAAARQGSLAAERSRVLEATSDGVFALDPGWRITFMNGCARELVAGGRDLTGQVLWDAFPEAVGGAFWQAYRRCMAERVPTEAEEHYAPLGRAFAARAFPSEGGGVTVFFRDVTEARAASARLAESEARLRVEAERVDLALAAGAIIGTWNWDLPTDRFTVDERFAQAFGLDPALGHSGLSLEQVIATVHPDDLAGLRQAIAEAIARGGAYSHEYRVRGRDGLHRWIEANGRVDHAPDGTPLRFPGVLLDVERRHRLEAERDRADALLRAILEAVPGVVYAKDREGRMLLANRGTAEMIGRPVEEILGRQAPDFAPDPAAATAIMATDRRVVEHGATETVEEAIRRPDGTPSVWLSTKAPLRDAAGTVIGLVGASVDITERKRAEAVLARDKAELERLAEARGRALADSETRLAQASKMEALGRLAGGIAHDFNNVLQAVQGGIALATKRMQRDAEAAMRFLELASEATERGAAVTGRLLAFARRGELSAGPVEPAPLLEGLEQILRHTLGPSVDLRADVEPGTGAVLADAGQLEAVLVNLANNARDALPDGSGRVTLGARPATAGPGGCGVPGGLQPGDYVRLSVADDGQGMPPDVLARVTEPFFTTKPLGKGTGLGLAMARGFAEQSGGALTIESAPGRGTTVSIWLPRATAEAAARSAGDAGPAEASAAEGPAAAILLVDDEMGVRRTIAVALADRGHAVAEAENAAAALARLEAGVAADVLVTDLAMPGGMDGLALVREARRRRPGLPALLITGHAGEAGRGALREAAGSGPFTVVRKPASAEAVEAEIVAMLRAARPVAAE